ncbi:MAG: deoxyribonuclease IV [candidate division Zixibacteria bacterium 4484_95]|nr:MAG: deoxyribonuclease IV [candidate division Zixibacteria bacterium 4484_95]RKX19831.1 MAG: deoxyribonuclease IV [candidate division Zixibacteria bacterium]
MGNSKQKLYLGAHMSIAGGVFNAFGHGEEFGCDTIQIFVKSSNQWKAKPLTDEEVQKFKEEQKRTGIKPVVAHDSYLINLGSPDPALLEKSRKSFLMEMERCERLGISYLVTHPGSHMGIGEKEGINKIAESIIWLLERTDGFAVKIVLETTAGQGTNLGYKFEQIAALIEKSRKPEKLMVCFDTCHAFAAGYDISTLESYEKTFEEFRRIIGLKKLAVLHLNDSKKGLGSKVDRHEHIGQGMIGKGAFKLIMQDSRFKTIPKILETPKGNDGRMDDVNLSLLRRFARSKKKK